MNNSSTQITTQSAFLKSFFTMSLILALGTCEVKVSDVNSSSAENEIDQSAPPAVVDGENSNGSSNPNDPNYDGPVEPIADEEEIDPWDQPYDGDSNPYVEVTDTFNVLNKAKPVDVLFVMDNSGSMAEEQQKVVDSFSSFLEGFTAQRIDYHIGVISTDSSSEAKYWNNSAYANFPNAGAGSLLAFTGNERFIKTAHGRSEALRQFRQNALLGTKGGAAETGLLAATYALGSSMTNANGWNAGFLREDSFLEVVIVSDEDEAVGNRNTNYIKNVNAASEEGRINSFVNRLAALRPNRPDLVRVDFVIAPTDQACTSALQVGSTYTKAHSAIYPVANQYNGKILNICTEFSAELGALGGQIAVQVERRFKISKGVEGELVVKLNNQRLDVSSQNGFTYDSAKGEINLHGLDLENLDQFTVTVGYIGKK
jgi:hypothetical protein